MDELKARQAAMKLRLLEVVAETAEASRRYVVEQLATPRTTLVALWAEEKQLVLELHKINIVLRAEKAKATELKAHSFFDLLVAKCKASGNSHLVEEARAESLTALADAGMLEVYQTKL